MRVLVTGGRDRTSADDRLWLYAGLNLLHELTPITEIIEGGAQGFDLAAKNWALWRKACGDVLKLTTVKAEWTRYGPGAGPIRNRKMAEMQPDLVLACPGGDGTANMIDQAQTRGIRVVMLERMPVIKKEGGRQPPPEVIIDAVA